VFKSYFAVTIPIMETPNSKINELLVDIYNNIELIVRKVVVEALESSKVDNTKSLDVEYDFLTATQAAKFLGRKLSTLYKDVHQGNIPFHKSGARKLLFSKTELEEYVLKSKNKSKEEIEDEVSTYIKSNNRFK
jgi:excisionase family DNA binding protein